MKGAPQFAKPFIPKNSVYGSNALVSTFQVLHSGSLTKSIIRKEAVFFFFSEKQIKSLVEQRPKFTKWANKQEQLKLNIVLSLYTEHPAAYSSSIY